MPPLLPHRLPSRGWALVLLVLVILLFLASLTTFVLVRPYAHPFWRHQPVAWTQILPAQPGLIQAVPNATQTATAPPGYPPLPSGLRVRVLRVGAPVEGEATVTPAVVASGGPDASPRVWRQLAALWGTTPAFAKWASLAPGTRLVVVEEVTEAGQGGSGGDTDGDGRGGGGARSAAAASLPSPTLAGALLCTPTAFHTPIHEGLRGFTVNRLRVREDRRGQGLCPHLLQATFAMATQPGRPMEVALFAHQLDLEKAWMPRLPFAPVAHVVRSKRVLSPAMLPDPPTELRHRVVSSLDALPRKCAEASAGRVEAGEATLEPTPDGPARRAHWAYVVANPLHTLLAVEGTEWVHLQRLDPHTVAVAGTSYGPDRHTELAAHVLSHLKQAYAAEHTHVTLVVPYGSVDAYPEATLAQASVSGAPTGWGVYDAHDLHMYNYRLAGDTVGVPLTMNWDVV